MMKKVWQLNRKRCEAHGSAGDEYTSKVNECQQNGLRWWEKDGKLRQTECGWHQMGMSAVMGQVVCKGRWEYQHNDQVQSKKGSKGRTVGSKLWWTIWSTLSARIGLMTHDFCWTMFYPRNSCSHQTDAGKTCKKKYAICYICVSHQPKIFSGW